MQTRHLLLGLLFLKALVPSLNAQPSDGEIVRGPNFEGVIFTPKMVQDSNAGSIAQESGLWTPSMALVLKAEAAIPAAIAEKIKYPKPVRGPKYPTYYSAKYDTKLVLAKIPPATSQPYIPDSEFEDNFLYEIPDISNYRCQFIGRTVGGRKLLYLSFIAKLDDPSLQEWKHQWIEVLDGYDLFWDVYYDPATGIFSGWSS